MPKPWNQPTILLLTLNEFVVPPHAVKPAHLPPIETPHNPTNVIAQNLPLPLPPQVPLPISPQGNWHCPTSLLLAAPGGDNQIDGYEGNAVLGGATAPQNITSSCPWQNVGTYKDGPAKLRQLPIDGKSYNFTFHTNIISNWEHPVAAIANTCVTEYHPQQSFCITFSPNFIFARLLVWWSHLLVYDVWSLDFGYMGIGCILFQLRFWSTLTCSASQSIKT